MKELKEIVITMVVSIAVVFVISPPIAQKTFEAGQGFGHLGTVATSGAMAIIGDVQILATSTSRRWAKICNTSTTGDVFLSYNNDVSASVTSGLFLGAKTAGSLGGCEVIDGSNPYIGAVRATSTVTSELSIIEF